MSITDELRKYISGPARWGISHICEENIVAIADRIDAENEKAVQKEFVRVYTSDADMEHDGWIRLPKDADGKYIHIGDELEGYGYPKGGAYCKAILNEVMILAGPKDSSYRSWLMWDATEVRHHETTVEDVLDEFASAYDRIGGEDEEHQKYLDLIAEYAAKLRLANSEEQ